MAETKTNFFGQDIPDPTAEAAATSTAEAEAKATEAAATETSRIKQLELDAAANAARSEAEAAASVRELALQEEASRVRAESLRYAEAATPAKPEPAKNPHDAESAPDEARAWDFEQRLKGQMQTYHETLMRDVIEPKARELDAKIAQATRAGAAYIDKQISEDPDFTLVEENYKKILARIPESERSNPDMKKDAFDLACGQNRVALRDKDRERSANEATEAANTISPVAAAGSPILNDDQIRLAKVFGQTLEEYAAGLEEAGIAVQRRAGETAH